MIYSLSDNKARQGLKQKKLLLGQKLDPPKEWAKEKRYPNRLIFAAN
jgi:hypothetical protein